jgi:hypothetical protein
MLLIPHTVSGTFMDFYVNIISLELALVSVESYFCRQ